MSRKVIGHVVTDRSGIKGVSISGDRISRTYVEVDPDSGRPRVYEEDPITGNYVCCEDEDAISGRIHRIIDVIGEEPDENLPSIGRLYLSAKEKEKAKDKSYTVIDDGDSIRLVRN